MCRLACISVFKYKYPSIDVYKYTCILPCTYYTLYIGCIHIYKEIHMCDHVCVHVIYVYMYVCRVTC